MSLIALKMLMGDRIKYLGLVFGIAFATLLIAQQTSIFVGLMIRTTSTIRDVPEAQIWVMDPRVEYIDEAQPLRDVDLYRVRAVEGVRWAVPFFKGQVVAKTIESNRARQITLIGLDDQSLVGKPPKLVLGDIADLRKPNAILVDRVGYEQMFPGEPLQLGRIVEMNDKRAQVVGICERSVPFLTFPIFVTRYTEAIDFAPPTRNQMSFLLCGTNKGENPAKVAEAISKQTGLQALVARDFMWRSVNYYLKNTGIPISFGMTITLGIIVGCAIVGLTFNLFVSENLKQFGALKAIGVTNTQILKMVFLQASLVIFVGYGIGIGAAAAFFERAKSIENLRDFALYWQIMAAIAVIVIVIATMAIFLSIQKVIRLDPAVVFRG